MSIEQRNSSSVHKNFVVFFRRIKDTTQQFLLIVCVRACVCVCVCACVRACVCTLLARTHAGRVRERERCHIFTVWHVCNMNLCI
jgi:hypothetical protein